MNLNFNNVDRFCSQIAPQDQKILIDFSTVNFVTQFALVYLGLFLRQKKQTGFALDYVAPVNTTTRDYLEKQNFFTRFQWPRPIDLPAQVYDSVEMMDIRSDPGLPDEYAEKLRKLLVDLKLNLDIAEFCEICAEILDNLVLHSEDEFGLCAFQYYPAKNELRIAFGDCGIGFRQSLSRNPLHAHLLKESSSAAIEKALKDGVTRFSETRGSGLSMLLD